MALTVTSQKETQVGGLKLRVLTVAFDSSYPTGGEALTADDLGVDPVYVMAEPNTGLVFEYDYANEKLIAYESGTASAALDEADNGDDLSGLTAVRVLAIGV